MGATTTAMFQINQAHTILAEARAKVTIAEPIAALDQDLKNHDNHSKHKIDGAKRFAAVIGHPAPAWEIKDLDGRTHTLEQYREKCSSSISGIAAAAGARGRCRMSRRSRGTIAACLSPSSE
jgi:hypothetical protein